MGYKMTVWAERVIFRLWRGIVRLKDLCRICKAKVRMR